MDRSSAEAPGPVGATTRSRAGPVWWGLAFGAVALAGLAVLTWALLVMHALFYGTAAVIAPELEAAPPDSGRYRLAFVAGVLVHLTCASALTWLAPRTAIRTWPFAAQALTIGLVAAALASCALLLTLGIRPVEFLLGLWSP